MSTQAIEAPTGHAQGGPAHPANRPPRRGHRPWPLLLCSLVCAAVLTYLLAAYVPPHMSRSRVPETSRLAYALLLGHIGTASVALLAGPAQLWPWLRRRHPRVHRWTGRTYLFLGVLPSALLVIPVTLQTHVVGASSQLGTLLFGLLWFGTALAGYRAARERRFADHQGWMIRNFALTFGKVTNVLIQPPVYLLVAAQDPAGAGTEIIHDVAGASTWLAFALNLIVAEWYIQRRYGSLRPAWIPAA